MNSIIFKDTKKDLSGETGMYAVGISQEIVKEEIKLSEAVEKSVTMAVRAVSRPYLDEIIRKAGPKLSFKNKDIYPDSVKFKHKLYRTNKPKSRKDKTN